MSVPLSNSPQTDTLPNGHSYCLYQKTSGDRYAGVFDKIVGQAVDFFPIFQEVPDGTHDTTNSSYIFVGYEARYSTNLHINGAYCANGYPSDITQKGFYPGTCYNGGHGNFDRMCFIQMSPSSTVGAYMLAHGMGNRIAGGGSVRWGAYAWAPQYVDDGVYGWSMGAIYSPGGGLSTGRRASSYLSPQSCSHWLSMFAARSRCDDRVAFRVECDGGDVRPVARAA